MSDPPQAEASTFTGKPLAEMTLAQKLCELREDRLRIIGLQQSFAANLRLAGLGFALKRWWQRRFHKGKGSFDEALAGYRQQVDDDLAAIEHDAQAWQQDGYRDSRHIDAVARTIERFGRQDDTHAVADLRRYVKLHRVELAREVRRLELDEA